MARRGVTACFFVLFLATFSGTALSGDDRSALSTVATDLAKDQSIVVAAAPTPGPGQSSPATSFKARREACKKSCKNTKVWCVRKCKRSAPCSAPCYPALSACIARCYRN